MPPDQPEETGTRHSARIELRDLQLATGIGTYAAGDVVPEAHLLDLTLVVSPGLVQVAADDMALVFDYDPLIAQIDRIAREQPCETQELKVRVVSVRSMPLMSRRLSLMYLPVSASSGM